MHGFIDDRLDEFDDIHDDDGFYTGDHPDQYSRATLPATWDTLEDMDGRMNGDHVSSVRAGYLPTGRPTDRPTDRL